MEGYLKNKSVTWVHAFKQSIRPGGKIDFDKLYTIYGKKYGLKEGEEFLTWLKSVKLKDSSDKWELVLQNDTTPKELSREVGAEVKAEVIKDNQQVQESTIEVNKDTPNNFKDYKVEDVVLLSVRKAREIIPQITDAKLLKYALQEAKNRPNKDSLVQLLYKRVQEISVVGRY